ncbi:tetratricopeptide repeat protein [uncultured Kordia sp.]|uniref:tetratricopeptide repeat protein n=1 Tax=uncultured Kordia sp. TaxID=507699 RepID=UPI0026338E16|nr:tetratricopeptide repeat protein [uncultured Kordia sp.]
MEITTKSIAVLPFVNMSNDKENEYFCDGITEEIINALTKIKGLKVTARTSSFAFKNKNVHIKEIGSILNVTNVLEGSIRIYKNTIRITVQLINAIDGFPIWSKRFQRNLEDIFELQDEISLIIAEQIRENFGHFHIAEQIPTKGTKNINAYKSYLKGRQFQLNWKLEDYLKAIEMYKIAIQEDAQYADAYFSLSRSYGILTSWGYIEREEGIKNALFYLEKGFQINPNSYLGFFSKSSVSFWINWDYEKGILYLKQTLAINPNYAIAHEGLAEIYIATNQLEKALIYIDKAIAINPLSPNHYFTKGNIYFTKKQYKNAIEYLNIALEIDSNFALAIETKLACLLLLKDKKAFNQYILERDQLLKPDTCRLLFDCFHSKKSENKHTNITIQDSFKSLYPWNFYLLIHSGKITEAMAIFEEKINLRFGQLVNYKLDPFLAPLRSHKKYEYINKQIISHTTNEIIHANDTEQKSNIKPLSAEETNAYKNLLINTLKNDQLYLNSDLSLKQLGNTINLHPNKLSWLLNTEFNKNFNDFINQYRLAHFKTIAIDPKFEHITILGLAYDSGFNSKSVFNTYFKKVENSTPSQWIKKQL